MKKRNYTSSALVTSCSAVSVFLVKIAATVLVLLTLSIPAHSQFYIGPHIGFKSSGLEGATTERSQGQTGNLGVWDAGNTGFNVGLTTGFQVLPQNSLYLLDINLDVSWSMLSFLENGYNSSQGPGSFSAQGFNGGKTHAITFDLMPMHRFNFNGFLLSPYAGVGASFNLYLNRNFDQTSEQGSINFNTSNEFKVGLLVFYGTTFQVNSLIQPFIQLKHMIGFGDSMEFTESITGSQGSQNYALSISDVPNFFSITAGVRFTL